MIDVKNEWYNISNVNEIDSPALVIYPGKIINNIHLLKSRVGNISMLRPHVKTNKMAEVCSLMLKEGITKFKCATIAEAEMLAHINAPDVLLAYQPVGPKINRLIKLIKRYPATIFSCLIDNIFSADEMNENCKQNNIVLNVFIDLNTGMNRTGIIPENGFQLFHYCLPLTAIKVIGLHAYDGHINDTDIVLRQSNSDVAFTRVQLLAEQICMHVNSYPVIVIGGSPSFDTHVLRQNVEHSPGTFIFWDWGYKHLLPQEPYQYAALVISRVISIIDNQTICTDLGHKSVAAETPLPRVHFLNAPNAVPIGQSEEHLMLRVSNANEYKIGEVLYGVPVHICPTVALYEKAIVIENNSASSEWKVIARDRRISI